jgi:hypothetical protein
MSECEFGSELAQANIGRLPKNNPTEVTEDNRMNNSNGNTSRTIKIGGW